MRLRLALVPFLLAAWLLAGVVTSHAQIPPPLPPLPQVPPRPAQPPVQVLPPPPHAPERGPLTGPRVFVREVRVVGSTIFTPEQLAAVAAPYVDREATAEDLEALRIALTRFYVDRGYVNSGAILPDQTVEDGVVTYRIVEGRLTGVDVEGNRWLWGGYYRRHFARAGGPPLNVGALQDQLLLLLEDPRIERINASLKPGVRPGNAVLDVRVEERFPISLWLDFNNYQSPSIGAERGIVTLEDLSLTGNADVLTLSYGRSDGMNPMLDFGYAIPFTPWDTTAGFRYRRNDFTIVEEPFTNLDIESNSEIFTLSVRQPVYRTPGTLVSVELIGERLSHETFLLGGRFDLEPGAVDGETVVTAIRAVQEFVNRTDKQVIAARSRFSVGVDALGSTIHSDQPDSRFFAWLGQFQWVRRFGLLPALGLPELQVLFRSDLQLASDSLLTLEQVAIGGRYSVRGYRENTFVRDNAFLASLEARLPVIRNVPWADYLQIASFFDYGRGWNHEPLPSNVPLDISSVGVGLRWGLTLRSPVLVRPQFEIYWGHPLRKIETPGGDLQDEGIHFQLLVGFF